MANALQQPDLRDQQVELAHPFLASGFGSRAGRQLLVQKRTCTARACVLRSAARHKLRKRLLLPGEQHTQLPLVSVLTASPIGH
jgi:hypothetical protein